MAGKTGTTDEKTDANFLGFTPQLAAFVWHGNVAGRVPGAGFGGEIPARIFQSFMSRSLDGVADEPFPAPGPVCDRPGKAIELPGQPTRSDGPAQPVPTTVPVAPEALPPVTSPPPTTPPTTTPPTTTPPPTTPPAAQPPGS